MSEEQSFESIFAQAIEIENPEIRQAYISRACGEDDQLRIQVERLVDAHFAAGDFLADFEANGQTERYHTSPPSRDSYAGVGPGDCIGPYKLLQQIGEGGMGVVFMAEQIEPIHRQVALKIIKVGMDTRQVIARFEAERQALALMDHQNIALVLDAGTTEQGRPYFVMELVKGIPITEYCDTNHLTPRERLDLFIPICRAIQHAHQKGIIHRDVKPNNVLVALYDGRPVPKVIDFGIAKATQQRLTERTMFTALGQIVGTMEYMSPEQAEMNQLDIDTRSDVYSLGVLLYELLTGTTPITKEQLRDAGYAKMLHTIREVEFPKPSTRLSQSGEAISSISAVRKTEPARLTRLLRGDLDWIVMKALEKDRTRRYETANGLAADVERFLQDEAVVARPPSPAYKLRKFARRNKTLLSTLLVIAAVLLASSIVSTWSAIRAVRAEGVAEERLVQVEQERNQTEIERQRAITNERQAQQARRVAEIQKDEAIWNQYLARQYPIIDAWKRRDFGHLERMLDELIPNGGEPDFRGWEWTYFRDQCNQAFTAMEGNRCAWDPRRPHLAVVVKRDNSQSAIELRSPGDGSFVKTIAVLQHDDAGDIRCLCWSLEGSRIAYGTNSGIAVVVDVRTGVEVFRKVVHEGELWDELPVRAIDLSHDGTLLATSNFDGDIQLWRVDASAPASELFIPEIRGHIECLAFDPTSTHLAVAQRFGARTTWNIKTGARFDYTPQSNVTGVLAWNASGTLFACTEGNSLAVYQLNSPDPIGKVEHSHASCVAWLSDDRLVTGGGDQVIRVWGADSLELLGEYRIATAPINTITASYNDAFLAIVSDSIRTTPLARTLNSATVLRPSAPHISELHYLEWDQAGHFIASSPQEIYGANSFISRIRVWDTRTEELLHEKPFDGVRTLSWRGDQKAVWMTTLRGRFHELEMRTDALNTLTKLAEDTNVSKSHFSPNSRWLAMGDQDLVRLVDTDSFEVLAELETPLDAWCVQWSKDSKVIAIGSWDHLILWDPFQDKVLVQQKIAGSINKLAWSPNGRLLAVAMSDGQVQIRETRGLRQVAILFGHTDSVSGVDWAGNGRRIASAAGDASVRIWDAATGREVLSIEHPEGLPFMDVEWSPDSQRLAAGDDHGNVFIWGSQDIEHLPDTAQGLSTGLIAKHLAKSED